MRYPPTGGYSAIPCDTLKNVDAICIAIPYSAIGGGRNVGPLRLCTPYDRKALEEREEKWPEKTLACEGFLAISGQEKNLLLDMSCGPRHETTIFSPRTKKKGG